MNNRLRLLFACVVATLLLSACATRSQGPLRDLSELPQDLSVYLDPASSRAPIFTADQRQELAVGFLASHFSPWHRSAPSNSRDDLFWGFTKYQNRSPYGENYLPRDPRWINSLALNADPGDYPNQLAPAIATAHTSMRVLPSAEPLFDDPTQPGEGFPFDYNQNSLVWAGTPLFVVQTSADGAWLLCESRFAGGWIPSRDVGLVDDAFMTEFSTGPFLALTHEDIPIKDQTGLFLFQGRIGMLLPLRTTPDNGENRTVLVPVRNLDGHAQLLTAELPETAGAHFPLVPSPYNIAALGNRMMGQPYGWGGLYEHRDCSSTLMDLFAPFGIKLPRNSRSQAQAGQVMDVSKLSPEEKKTRLLTLPPLTTLVGKRGHIMLYAGQSNGEPLIYHTVWGVRTTDTGPLPGRKIIGATVITTLEPGKELRNLAPGALLVNTISTFTTLVPEGQ
ncbi:MAG: SH3 domain-containing protein [Proteobacteria bacterium]|nr:SH3 domain-containing protein [Pseudomonadota bacterium]